MLYLRPIIKQKPKSLGTIGVHSSVSKTWNRLSTEVKNKYNNRWALFCPLVYVAHFSKKCRKRPFKRPGSNGGSVMINEFLEGILFS